MESGSLTKEVKEPHTDLCLPCVRLPDSMCEALWLSKFLEEVL
jgi:hypothetical protein